MAYQIKAKTPAGVRLSEAAEDLIPKLRDRAAQADRSDVFTIEPVMSATVRLADAQFGGPNGRNGQEQS